MEWMTIKLTDGRRVSFFGYHLTALDRKAIRAMYAAGSNYATTPQQVYEIKDGWLIIRHAKQWGGHVSRLEIRE